MNAKVNNAVVGFFVVVFGTALIGITLWLSAGNFQGVVYDTYLAYMRESVSGLNLNAPVKYRGVEVGKVREIMLDPNNPEQVRLKLEIERGTPVKFDSVAVLSVQGLTGIAFVDLTGGSRAAPLLKAAPGQEYPEIRTGPSLFTRVDMALNQALTNLNRLTDDVHALLEPKNRIALSNILAHIDAVTGALAARDSAMQAGVDHAVKTLENTAKASADLPQLMASIKDTAKSLGIMANQLAGASGGLTKTVEHSRHDVEVFTQQTLPETAQLVGNLRELSTDLQRLTQQLERDPSAILYGKHPAVPGPGE
jgi:phospholipid/cholesterol/gamma-HCH transport system substrate-binding protein